MQDPPAPTRIHADRAAGILSLEWPDGHVTAYDMATLRWLCPCAYCRGEAGLPGWLDSNPTLTPEQTRLVTVSLVGRYALAPTWGDGHATGFYSFALLRDACPCADCAATRADRTPSVAASGPRAHHAHVPRGDDPPRPADAPDRDSGGSPG